MQLANASSCNWSWRLHGVCMSGWLSAAPNHCHCMDSMDSADSTTNSCITQARRRQLASPAKEVKGDRSCAHNCCVKCLLLDGTCMLYVQASLAQHSASGSNEYEDSLRVSPPSCKTVQLTDHTHWLEQLMS